MSHEPNLEHECNDLLTVEYTVAIHIALSKQPLCMIEGCVLQAHSMEILPPSPRT